ncbi:LacI family DNA-binding transcriptional regulator [Rhodohalobacter sp. 614A]|uniref:LacI family DNA-binding transcriptional regulator n=1 Tax=Rhodohalobacter sp. 614A TaxID=2908649 RepID=UPI001F47CB67|nr:LacI family DNA-binding transcriptional regulator [Rhodohalobacter sp. 614A]
MKKKTTIYDIAEELGVTASTVSRALNDHPNVKDSTKKLVMEKAKKMNYQPNSIAAALRNGKSNTIGVIVPNMDRNFFASVVRGIENVVSDTGYNIIICQSNDSLEKERANINTLLEAQVDGILASYAKETTDFSHYEEVIKRDVPLILFDRVNDSLGVGAVIIDDYLGAFKATEHLIKQGCRRIVHLSGPTNISIYKERRRGYEEALQKYDIPVDENLIIYSDLKLEDGYSIGKELLKLDPLPDAIFSASDFSAVGAMEVLKNAGIAIPEQVAIVGFSNEQFTSFVEPGLTSVDQRSIQMGSFTAKLFLDSIDKKSSTSLPPKIVLNPDLIVRKSSLKQK